MGLEEARTRVRERLAAREQNFLGLVERAIFGYRASPYRKLLDYAGCEPGDVRRLVAQDGVDGALRTLADAGVFVTFDELHGRRAVVRGSARFAFIAREFDSPLIAPHYVVYTGGTRGRPGVVLRSLPFVEEVGTDTGAAFDAYGLAGARHVFWLVNPLTQMLICTKLRQQTVGWLHPLRPFFARARVRARYIALLGRLGGQRLPVPGFLDVRQADRLAGWLGRRPRDGRPLVLNTLPSSAVRVADAAHAAGIDLTGVIFHLQSEPVTEARHAHMRSSGARVVVNYSAIEMPGLSYSCAAPRSADDMHFFSDRYALVERERQVTHGGPTVNALLFSTLMETAPKICLNTELGDYARVEQRACGCRLGGLGLTTHLSEIRSFEKLSGEGVTFARSNLLHILEGALPAQFGGSSVDYQLLEEEAADSAMRLVLRVSPAVGEVDEGALRSALLAELGRGGIVDQHHAELLRRAGAVTISRQRPLATRVGKILPFQLAKRPGESPPAPSP